MYSNRLQLTGDEVPISGTLPPVLTTVEETSMEELSEAHYRLRAGIAGDLIGLSPEVYFAPQGEHWSPAEHIDHLTRCDEALLRALTLPYFFLRLRYGRARGGSRPIEEVVAKHLDKIAAGACARGRYRPQLPPPEERTDTRQRVALTGYSWLDQRLGPKVLYCGEEEEADLDRYRLRFPVLGRLTIREMLVWSLYHHRQHHRLVLERLHEGGHMSRCMAIHFEDDSYVELGPDAPQVYRGYDYGSNIGHVWDQITALGRRLGLGDLDAFVCPEEEYLDLEELQERIEEAEDEEDEELAALLRTRLVARLPSHDPEVMLKLVRGLIAHLEREPEGDLAEIGLTDLKGYEIALSRCAAEGREAFISPL